MSQESFDINAVVRQLQADNKVIHANIQSIHDKIGVAETQGDGLADRLDTIEVVLASTHEIMLQSELFKKELCAFTAMKPNEVTFEMAKNFVAESGFPLDFGHHFLYMWETCSQAYKLRNDMMHLNGDSEFLQTLRKAACPNANINLEFFQDQWRQVHGTQYAKKYKDLHPVNPNAPGSGTKKLRDVKERARREGTRKEMERLKAVINQSQSSLQASQASLQASQACFQEIQNAIAKFQSQKYDSDFLQHIQHLVAPFCVV